MADMWTKTDTTVISKSQMITLADLIFQWGSMLQHQEDHTCWYSMSKQVWSSWCNCFVRHTSRLIHPFYIACTDEDWGDWIKSLFEKRRFKNWFKKMSWTLQASDPQAGSFRAEDHQLQMPGHLWPWAGSQEQPAEPWQATDGNITNHQE